MASTVDIDIQLEVEIDDHLEFLRAVPVERAGERDALLLIHSGQSNVDPWENAFEFPTDTLRLTLVTAKGAIKWTTDLGEGIVPGIWFCPVYPFDLDGDGTEEIWCVQNVETETPLHKGGHRLARIDAITGETTGQWDWLEYPSETLSHTYRNFIFGGHAGDEPVLVIARGTYNSMELVGLTPELERRWEHRIAPDDPGARGSHLCPVVDLNDDGVDEVLWGERLIELDGGEELWCADRDHWTGHSDIVLPTRITGRDEWFIYTCREGKGNGASPRVVMYDENGEIVWSAVEDGHMHWGWTASVGEDGRRLAMAARTPGIHGSPREEDKFLWDAETGEPLEWDYDRLQDTLPVDIDGDGTHELWDRQNGTIVAADGTRYGEVDHHGQFIQPGKFLGLPGEQVITFTATGTVRIWGDATIEESASARERFEHPYYAKAQKLAAVGYNWRNLGGL